MRRKTTTLVALATAAALAGCGTGIGQVPATELVLRRLLPMARQGLDSWGVPTEHSDRLLGVIGIDLDE